MARPIKQPIMPAKYQDYPDDKLINSNGLAWIFHVDRTSVSKLVKSKRIPKPDTTVNKQNFWKIGTIREILNESKRC
jgi:hypothetical protein